MRIAFIGGGRMAEAILSGLIRARAVDPADVSVGEPIEERAAYLKATYEVQTTKDNREAVQGSQIIVLAVKPQDLPEACGDMRSVLIPGQTVLSIVAGATLSKLSRLLDHRSVVRVMPNTPAQVGFGMTVWTTTSVVDDATRSFVAEMCSALGEQLYVAEEKYLDMATALSASGPAFIWLFLEALIDGGVHLGLTRDMASKLSIQTMLGSAHMARELGSHPAQLRNMVTSPGGTTVEGLMALEEGSLRAVVGQALLAAYEKSQILGDDV